MSGGDQLIQEKPKRPGCVTAYAILLWIGSTLGVVSVLCLSTGGLGFFEGGLGIVELCLGLFILLIVAGGIAAGVGIWQMRKWGWALVIVYQVVSIITSLGSAVLFLTGESIRSAASSAGNIIGIFISGYVLYWFYTNRELFNGGTTYRRVVGPDGETMIEPAEKKPDNTVTLLLAIGGLFAVAILICVVVIAMLAILGPQIGNVFSQITFELETAA